MPGSDAVDDFAYDQHDVGSRMPDQVYGSVWQQRHPMLVEAVQWTGAVLAFMVFAGLLLAPLVLFLIAMGKAMIGGDSCP